MGDPLPVLLLVRELGIGGCERDLSKVAAGLDRSRFDPHVGCFYSEGPRAEELRSAGVSIVEFPVRSFLRPSIIPVVVQMRNYIRQHGIRLIHAFDGPTDIFAVPIARALGIPVISSNLWHRSIVSFSYKTLLRITDRLANAIVVNSEATRDHLIADEKVAAGMIHVCYNGVETNIFSPHGARLPEWTTDAAPLVIGSVCVLRSEKRMDMLLEAFAAVRHLQPGMKLLIVGSGAILPALEEQRTRLGLTEDCVFVPAQKDVASWMRGMDIFAAPSFSESFPNGLLEAMACGCCVVASRVGGIPELVTDRHDGLLFDRDDKKGFVEALTKVISDAAVRRRLGQAASQTASERFSIDITLAKTATIYDSVLRNGKGSKTKVASRPAPATEPE